MLFVPFTQPIIKPVDICDLFNGTVTAALVSTAITGSFVSILIKDFKFLLDQASFQL